MPPKIYPRGAPSGYDPQAVCAYHSGAPEHPTNNCWVLKHKIQNIIEIEDIVLKKRGEQGQNIIMNSFPEHKGIYEAFTPIKKFENPELVRSLPLEGSFDKFGELSLVKIHENHSYVCLLFNYVFVNSFESSDF